ncbi:transposase [Haloferax larsenii JCM 13917]|nr:DUF4157 domain-containing protein [Haloferax larsenii]ELZ79676.1 transposase [Haloferax larsenii JCM 13917]
MGFRTARESTTEAERSSVWNRDEADSSRNRRRRRGPRLSATECENLFGLDMYRDGLEVTVQRLVQSHGAGQVRQWADEGMTVETMGKPRDMREFRDRQQERPAEVPKDIERRNAKSVQRSRNAHHEASKAGDAQVPDSVRDVISSPGQQLDSSIQQVIEERMGDNLGDVRIHTGPQAAKACEDINARAFTVGNHIAFNHGEYDPSSAEGQHVLAHELAHVRQQTGGAVSMLPQTGELEIDPDERLEREAEETAKRVMRGGELGIFRMRNSDVHVQRVPKDQVFGALAVFELENENKRGDIGDFQHQQNERRIGQMREWLSQYNQDTTEVERKLNEVAAQNLIETEVESQGGTVTGSRIEGPTEITDEYLDHEEAKQILEKDLPSKSELEAQKRDIENELGEKMEQVAMTESQRDDLEVGVERGLLGKLGEKTAFWLLAKVEPLFKVVKGGYEVVKNNWGKVDGDIVERAMKLREELLDEVVTEMEFNSGSDPLANQKQS